MRELVMAVAGKRIPGDTNESWLRKASRLAGTSYRQAKALYYGEITDPDHKTVTKFKRAAGRYEAENLASQFEGIADAMGHRDALEYSADVTALLVAARALRGLAGTGNSDPSVDGD